MTLTSSDKHLLDRVCRPNRPRLTFWLLIIIFASGLLLAALTIGSYVRLSHMISDTGVQAGFQPLLTKSWILLLTATQTLWGAFCVWSFRRYERMIRKLAESHDA